MATRARATEKVYLHDDTELELRPLTIKNLRVFMDQLEEVREKMEDEDEVNELGMLENFIELARFCINSQVEKEYSTDELEEVIDMPGVQDVMRICAGIELGNPTATTTGQNPLGRR